MKMIFKKGDIEEPLNYRGIALINNVTKNFTNILKGRLESFAEARGILPESQMGFRKGRGCTECIFALQTAVQLQLRLGKREVYAIFVDFKRAFDSIPHGRLWSKLCSLGVSRKMLNIIRSLYDQASMQVKSRNTLSNEFQVTEGVLQGESLSPLLFILYISDFEDFFRGKGLEGLNIDGYTDPLMLLYADDTVIFAHSHIDLERKLKALGEYCDLNGLTVNISKTNIMIFKNNGKPKSMEPRFTRYKDAKHSDRKVVQLFGHTLHELHLEICSGAVRNK